MIQYILRVGINEGNIAMLYTYAAQVVIRWRQPWPCRISCLLRSHGWIFHQAQPGGPRRGCHAATATCSELSSWNVLKYHWNIIGISLENLETSWKAEGCSRLMLQVSPIQDHPGHGLTPSKGHILDDQWKGLQPTARWRPGPSPDDP